MGFVVDRYLRVRNFVPEEFWSINLMHRRDDIDVTFHWGRYRLFDRMAVVILFERCLGARVAKVSKMQKKPTSKWRPLPLTTVELQKMGSMFLRMDSQKVMKVSYLRCHMAGLASDLPLRLPKTFTRRVGSVTLALKQTSLIKGSI